MATFAGGSVVLTVPPDALSAFEIISRGLPKSIPSSIGDLANLKRLRLAYGLTGSIPLSIGNLTNLE
ncbi:MAG: hypothetical protein HKO65_16330 [Gemmatimonadetes bacterium]|nr:hypothetical protein [Gemmatimonadota bacterium]